MKTVVMIATTTWFIVCFLIYANLNSRLLLDALSRRITIVSRSVLKPIILLTSVAVHVTLVLLSALLIIVTYDAMLFETVVILLLFLLVSIVSGTTDVMRVWHRTNPYTNEELEGSRAICLAIGIIITAINAYYTLFTEGVWTLIG